MPTKGEDITTKRKRIGYLRIVAGIVCFIALGFLLIAYTPEQRPTGALILFGAFGAINLWFGYKHLKPEQPKP